MRTWTLPSWLSPSVRMQSAPGRGEGLFAVARIEPGERVLTWGGEFTDLDGAGEAQKSGRGTMRWDEDLFSLELPGPMEDVYRINHACDGNTWMVDAYTLVARCPIEPGEEVTVDYALWIDDEEFVASWPCRCGSPLCRGRATGRDWRLPEVQARYAGHFSPFMKRRIAQAKERPGD